jgi:hypothetical protein
MDTKFKLFLTIIGILLVGNVLASTLTENVTVTVIGPTNYTITQNVTVTVIESTIIENETYIPFCALERGNITFYADVSGPCTEEVIFSLNTNGTWENFTGHETIEGLGLGNYSYEIYSCLLVQKNLEWKVYAKDCYGYTYNGSLNEFYIYPRTGLTIIPSNPQGENLWYLTPPRFTLENSNSTEIFYKWGSSGGVHSYSGEFGMESSPIFNGGGTVDLVYWSALTCGEDESARRELIKLDLFPPEIRNIFPANNSLIPESKPDIYAKIIEGMGKGSGVDSSSIIVKLDGEVQTNCIINKTASPLDLVVKCSPNLNLPDGIHNVSVYAKDYSGRSSEFLWSFEIKKVDYSFDLKVYSPDEQIYSGKGVPFNLSTGKKVSYISYIDLNSSKPKEIKLCYNCNEYGLSRLKELKLNEGFHIVTIKAVNGFVIKEENVSFTVDSKAPRIYKTEPRVNQFTNGEFYIRFSEDNPVSIKLFINNNSNTYNIDLSECTKSEIYTDCYPNITLSGFEGQEIQYWVELKDIANKIDMSRKTKVYADSLAPAIEIVSPINDGTYNKKVDFKIKVNEPNFNSLSYVYQYKGKEREVVLFSTLKDNFCNKSKSFAHGEYAITIKAEDKAGHSSEIPVQFTVN